MSAINQNSENNQVLPVPTIPDVNGYVGFSISPTPPPSPSLSPLSPIFVPKSEPKSEPICNKKRKIHHLDNDNNTSNNLLLIHDKKRRKINNEMTSNIIQNKLKQLREYKMNQQIKYNKLQQKFKKSINKINLLQNQNHSLKKCVRKYQALVETLINNNKQSHSIETSPNNKKNKRKQKKDKKMSKKQIRLAKNRQEYKAERKIRKAEWKQIIAQGSNDPFLSKEQITKLMNNNPKYAKKQYRFLIPRLFYGCKLDSKLTLNDINREYMVNIMEKCLKNGKMRVITNNGLIECKYDKYIIILPKTFSIVLDLTINDNMDIDTDPVTVSCSKHVDYFKNKQLGINAKLTNKYEIFYEKKNKKYPSYKYEYNGYTIVFASNHTTIYKIKDNNIYNDGDDVGVVVDDNGLTDKLVEYFGIPTRRSARIAKLNQTNNITVGNAIKDEDNVFKFNIGDIIIGLNSIRIKILRRAKRTGKSPIYSVHYQVKETYGCISEDELIEIQKSYSANRNVKTDQNDIEKKNVMMDSNGADTRLVSMDISDEDSNDNAN